MLLKRLIFSNTTTIAENYPIALFLKCYSSLVIAGIFKHWKELRYGVKCPFYALKNGIIEQNRK
jgi:hypothetical protein